MSLWCLSNMPQNCRVNKVLPLHFTLHGHWVMFWCQYPLKNVRKAAGWRMGLWKLFQRLRRCLQAGDLDVTYLVGEKKTLRNELIRFKKIFMKKKRSSSLVKKNRKRAEAWKVKLLIQMKNEVQIFHEMVGNSIFHQGNEWSFCLMLQTFMWTTQRHQNISRNTKNWCWYWDISITHKDLWYISDLTR